MGLSESTLKPLTLLSHCKVSCDSPCCVKICGEDNHCIFDIDTHENVISDDDEQIERKNNLLRNVAQQVIITYTFVGLGGAGGVGSDTDCESEYRQTQGSCLPRHRDRVYRDTGVVSDPRF